ncbi:hypothetical protein GCM10008014_08470 [Paenibacillus silvae]|uniref:DnaD domain-containing protein n=1 Tax=Paenibacillus silvae TaxID=1325358 RepID=A0ABQ1Z2Z0_9BACL|nr:hypothetical protein [Paenibacillus silvae]GGH46050.1 hypothetical protein GCM10008014_08470 [Paenibacillus silvae]
MDGWIRLHRKIIESAIWDKPPLYIKVWMFLLISAQHSQYKGLQRGQMSLSIPDIIEGCKWRVGARTVRPTKDQVYQVIDWLRKPNEGGHESNAKATMITTTKATHGMLIEVVNYAVYQDSESDESNDESNDEKETKPARKQRQPNNINKNVKNDNNVKNEKDKKSVPKIQFAEFVSMTQSEYDKLVEQHGEDRVKRMIEILDNYKGANKKKYASDYRAILNWVVNRVQEEERKLKVIQGGGQSGRSRINERNFSPDRTTQKPAEYIGTPGSRKVIVPDDFEQQLRNFE